MEHRDIPSGYLPTGTPQKLFCLKAALMSAFFAFDFYNYKLQREKRVKSKYETHYGRPRLYIYNLNIHLNISKRGFFLFLSVHASLLSSENIREVVVLCKRWLYRVIRYTETLISYQRGCFSNETLVWKLLFEHFNSKTTSLSRTGKDREKCVSKLQTLTLTVPDEQWELCCESHENPSCLDALSQTTAHLQPKRKKRKKKTEEEGEEEVHWLGKKMVMLVYLKNPTLI